MSALVDLHFALRRLRRAPAFALAVTAMLALGIGLSVGMFGVLRGVLGSLPYPGGERLVAIETSNARQGVARSDLTPAERDALAAPGEASPFAAVGDFSWGGVTVIDGGRPRDVTVGVVGDGFFEALGMPPLHGRVFTADEMDGRQTAIVLAYHEWQRLFAGRVDAIGQEIDTTQGRMRVIGVMPGAFAYPSTEMGGWVARGRFDAAAPPYRFARMLGAVGRLKDGVAVDTLRPRLDAIAARVHEAQRLPDEGWRFDTPTVLDTMVGDVRGTIWGAFGIALLVLLIACANVAILFDARQVAQRHQFVIAHALGASALRVWRTRLFELLALAAGGVALGAFVAWQGLTLVRTLAEGSVPRADAIVIDPAAIAFAVALGLATPFVVMLAGALRRRDADALLRRVGNKGVLAGDNRARRFVPAVAVALSTVSLIAATALTLSLVRLAAVEPGFRSDHVQVLQLFRDSPPTGWLPFADELRARLAALPGVREVAVTTSPPLSGIGNLTIDAKVVGRDDLEPTHVTVRRVGVGYLSLLDIPLLAGRAIGADDRADGERVAVVNRAYARQLGGDAAALGTVLSMPIGREGLQTYRVVGVMDDVRNAGLRSAPTAEVLVPFAQKPWVGIAFMVRSDRAITGLDRQMAETVWAIDPRQGITRQFALVDDLAAELRAVRFFTLTMGAFAIAALLLGAFGVYAVASLAQRRRVREFGLRLAVGARPSTLGWQVLRDGLAVVSIGAAIGIAGAVVALRLIAAQTFGIDSSWPTVMTIGAATMAIAALVALLLPAWRAVRIDPITALRDD